MASALKNYNLGGL